MNKEESIQKIQDQIDKVKEYIEYGMPYGEYLQLQLAFDDIVNLIQKQEKIIDYSMDRILPSPEEYLEIKNIMKQNKWGYDRSKKEYFKKEVEKECEK